MRQVREVLGLRTAGVGLNEVARRVGVVDGPVDIEATGDCRVDLAIAG